MSCVGGEGEEGERKKQNGRGREGKWAMKSRMGCKEKVGGGNKGKKRKEERASRQGTT